MELRGACARHRPALLDFVDRGEIAPRDRQALAHLDRCNRCTDELESMVLTITALRRLGDDSPGPSRSPTRGRGSGPASTASTPKRWVIMSPSAGMVMSIALVAVLVAPLQLGGPTSPSSAPAGPSAAEQAASREASRPSRPPTSQAFARERFRPLRRLRSGRPERSPRDTQTTSVQNGRR